LKALTLEAGRGKEALMMLVGKFIWGREAQSPRGVRFKAAGDSGMQTAWLGKTVCHENSEHGVMSGREALK